MQTLTQLDLQGSWGKRGNKCFWNIGKVELTKEQSTKYANYILMKLYLSKVHDKKTQLGHSNKLKSSKCSEKCNEKGQA
jgi:hypothetical protein